MRPWCSLCKANEKDIFGFPSSTASAKPQQSGLLPAAHIEHADEPISRLPSTGCKTVRKTQSQLCLKILKRGGGWKEICHNVN